MHGSDPGCSVEVHGLLDLPYEIAQADWVIEGKPGAIGVVYFGIGLKSPYDMIESRSSV